MRHRRGHRIGTREGTRWEQIASSRGMTNAGHFAPVIRSPTPPKLLAHGRSMPPCVAAGGAPLPLGHPLVFGEQPGLE
jgi:hypothetical protein